MAIACRSLPHPHVSPLAILLVCRVTLGGGVNHPQGGAGYGCCVDTWDGTFVGVRAHEVREAESLLKEVESWSEEDVASLPELYRRKVREYRRLANRGESEGISDSEE